MTPKWKEFNAEIITPLFIAGAENRRITKELLLKEGLRPPSIKGSLHFWFRAMMGGIIKDADKFTYLRELEGRLLGDIKSSSTFKIRTYLDDLYYHKVHLGMNDPRTPSKLAIIPPTKLTLKLKIEPKPQKLVLSTLWLATMIGNFGGRVTRAFGSIQLNVPKPSDGLNFIYKGNRLVDIKEFMETNFNLIYECFKKYANSGGYSGPPDKITFPVVSKEYTKLYVISPKNIYWRNWKSAMDDIRDKFYRKFKDYINVKTIGSPPIPSPLYLSIKKANQNDFFGIVLVFKDDIYVGKYKTYFKDNDGPFGKIEKFMKNMKQLEYKEIDLSYEQ
ncbi:MAG TPA: type III-B CRISPR module RAMP protein Cmr1 [Syntrophaceae bacterium]|nr:type III-B CRISPR module RAMP protein Cmr1 [Syntrophaceae bacterium]